MAKVKLSQLHLNPSCPDVAIKSAESDGCSSEWSYQHFRNCTLCRQYHNLVLAHLERTQESIMHIYRKDMRIVIPKGVTRILLEVER